VEIPGTPDIYEIEEMIEFCKKYSHIYIYGCAANQQYLRKYFDICNISIDGYVTTTTVDEPEWVYGALPIRLIDDVVNESNTGIILALCDKHFNTVIPKLRDCKFVDYFIMSEWNKKMIAYKMTPRKTNDMWFEVNLVEHCNLNCKYCTHFSPLAKPEFLDIEVFRKDMARLCELSAGKLRVISLLGGEPLLHRDVNQFIEIARSYYPESTVLFVTNGLLLYDAETNENGNFWQCCADNDVSIHLTPHPIELDINRIKEKARKYGVNIDIGMELRGDKKKKYLKDILDLAGKRDIHEFISCYRFNQCYTLRNGRAYTCIVVPNVHHFNNAFNQNLEITEADSIDIYRVETFEEITEFLSNRIPFCEYCDNKDKSAYKWARSDRTIDEYIG